MPGLLHADADSSNKKYAAIAAELVGSFLFAFFGGAAPASMGALANGILLAVLGARPAARVAAAARFAGLPPPPPLCTCTA